MLICRRWSQTRMRTSLRGTRSIGHSFSSNTQVRCICLECPSPGRVVASDFLPEYPGSVVCPLRIHKRCSKCRRALMLHIDLTWVDKNKTGGIIINLSILRLYSYTRIHNIYTNLKQVARTTYRRVSRRTPIEREGMNG